MQQEVAIGLAILLVILAVSCDTNPRLGDRYVADVTTTTVVNGHTASVKTALWNTTVDANCQPVGKVPVNNLSILYAGAKPSVSPGDRLEFSVTFESVELPTKDGRAP